MSGLVTRTRKSKQGILSSVTNNRAFYLTVEFTKAESLLLAAAVVVVHCQVLCQNSFSTVQVSVSKIFTLRLLWHLAEYRKPNNAADVQKKLYFPVRLFFPAKTLRTKASCSLKGVSCFLSEGSGDQKRFSAFGPRTLQDSCFLGKSRSRFYVAKNLGVHRHADTKRKREHCSSATKLCSC